MTKTLTISKHVFLSSLQCPTMGWYAKHLPPDESKKSSGSLFLDQGIMVGELARKCFPDGILIETGSLQRNIVETNARIQADPRPTLFEATFVADPFVAKADILIPLQNGWHLLEVKSGTKVSEGYVEDIAYTASVLEQRGQKVKKASLMLVNRDYRLGHADEQLFWQSDVTKEVRALMPEFSDSMAGIAKAIRRPARPKPRLCTACKSCEYFDTHCLGKDLSNSIFDLPNVRGDLFESLIAEGYLKLSDVPAMRLRNKRHQLAHEAACCGGPVYRTERLKNLLSEMEWPVHYLDFEAVATAVPIYEDVAPHEQVLSQYSLHIYDGPRQERTHFEYLADPKRDCREELAKKMIEHLGKKGSIIVYSNYEATQIKALIKRFPKLDKRLSPVLDRIKDLCKVFQEAIYHPEFRGSASIKATLPVMTKLGYDDLKIRNGTAAVEAFLRMAQDELSKREMATLRKHLLAYCKRDTQAMVELHHVAMEIAGLI